MLSVKSPLGDSEGLLGKETGSALSPGILTALISACWRAAVWSPSSLGYQQAGLHGSGRGVWLVAMMSQPGVVSRRVSVCLCVHVRERPT